MAVYSFRSIVWLYLFPDTLLVECMSQSIDSNPFKLPEITFLPCVNSFYHAKAF